MLTTSNNIPAFLKMLECWCRGICCMRINVKARPNSCEEKVDKIGDADFVVSVKEPPVQGKANRAIINALGVYFGIASARIKIVSGWTSRQKVMKVL